MMICSIWVIVTEQSHVFNCRMLCFVFFFILKVISGLLYLTSRCFCLATVVLGGILFRFGLARFSASGTIFL